MSLKGSLSESVRLKTESPLKGNAQGSPEKNYFDLQKFYLITCIFEPIDNKDKLSCYKIFSREVNRCGFELITVEFTSNG